MSDMGCEQARRLISLRLDGEPGDDDAHALGGHLAGCEACRRAGEQLDGIDAALRAGAAAIVPPPDLSARVRSAVHSRQQRQVSWRPAVWGLAAAAALALVIYGGGLLSRSDSPAVVARGGESLHVFTGESNVAHNVKTGDALDEDAVAWGINDTTIAVRFREGARLELSRQAVIKIGADSMTLIKGGLYADLTDATDDFTVITPWGSMSGRGSTFTLLSGSDDGAARLLVSEGSVRVVTAGGVRMAEAGASMMLRPNEEQIIVL